MNRCLKASSAGTTKEIVVVRKNLGDSVRPGRGNLRLGQGSIDVSSPYDENFRTYLEGETHFTSQIMLLLVGQRVEVERLREGIVRNTSRIEKLNDPFGEIRPRLWGAVEDICWEANFPKIGDKGRRHLRRLVHDSVEGED